MSVTRYERIGGSGGSTRMPVLLKGPCLQAESECRSTRNECTPHGDHLCMQFRNVGQCIMHVLLKGLSYDAKDECRSTPTSFQDCLNVMAHNSDVYSAI